MKQEIFHTSTLIILLTDVCKIGPGKRRRSQVLKRIEAHNFTISTRFHDFDQISQFQSNFTISTNFHNYNQLGNTLHDFNCIKTDIASGFTRNTAEVSQGLALVALESFTLCMTGSTSDFENGCRARNTIFCNAPHQSLELNLVPELLTGLGRRERPRWFRFLMTKARRALGGRSRCAFIQIHIYL